MKSLPHRFLFRLAASVAALSSLVATPLAAQQRGDTDTSTSSVEFTTSGQSVWGPGSEEVLDPWEYSVFTWGWSEDLSISEKTSWQGLWAGGGLRLETSGDLGLKVGMDNITAGDLTVRYPLGATVTFPAANSFRDGEPITIRSAWSLGSGGTIDAAAPSLRVYMATPFAAAGSVDVEVCILTCSSESLFSLNTGDTETTIFGAGPGFIQVGDTVLTAEHWEFGFVEKFLLGISGSVDVPTQYPSSTSSSGNRLTASRTQQWTDVNWDLDALLNRMHVTPPIGGGVNLDGNVIVGFNLYDFDLNLQHYQSRSFSIEGRPEMDVSFPVEVEWWVTNPAGLEVAHETSTTASLVVGHDLHLIFPEGTKTPMTAGTSYTLPNDFSSDAAFRFAGNLRDTLLSAQLKVPAFDGRKWLKTGTKNVWSFSCDAETYGQVTCDVAEALAGAARAVSDFWEKVVQDVFGWVTHNFAGIDLEGGPVEATIATNWDDTYDYFDETWQLQGFGAENGESFSIDPEDPSIAVSSSWEYSFPTSFTQTMVVENTGDVPLNAASVMDALDVAGLSVANIQSFDMTVNAGFDGLGDAESLLAGQEIPVGGSATITIRWAPTPGVYTADISTEGTSPIGTVVMAHADNTMEFGWSVMDIQPDSLNRKSRGQLPVHLYGTPGLAVTGIDQSSLALEGIAPNKVQVEDLNLDGIPDLKLRFDRPAVIAGMDARIAGLAPVVAAAEVATTTTETFELQAPEFTTDQVAGALLRGGAGFTQDDIFAMDRAGNGNGRLDVGDLRAAVLGGGTVLAMAKGGNGKGNAGGNNSGKTEEGGLGEGAPPEDFIFVLTGNMTDSTPFWAEDHAVVQGDAR